MFEAVKIFNRLKVPPVEFKTFFSYIPSLFHCACCINPNDQIAVASIKLLIQGYGDGTFGVFVLQRKFGTTMAAFFVFSLIYQRKAQAFQKRKFGNETVWIMNAWEIYFWVIHFVSVI